MFHVLSFDYLAEKENIMGETRFHIKHSLENTRDDYPYPLEEVIITELIANASDSGASKICFFVDPGLRIMRAIDNGSGMTSETFEQYHDIAYTTKTRGKGIGSAGVGAKLALLIAEDIVTETKNDSFYKSTRWRLENDLRAPWDYIETQGFIDSSNGTAVSIKLNNSNSDLLKSDFIELTIQKHFTPLLYEDVESFKIIYKIYRKGIEFYVNGNKIKLVQQENLTESKSFIVSPITVEKMLEKNTKQLFKVLGMGVGFVSKSKDVIPEKDRGIAISTYGKVINRGWDWLGVYPQNTGYITGIVEVPDLSEILTTNKAGFLDNVNTRQKYNRYRKLIQNAVMQVLRELGEVSSPKETSEKELKPLEKELDKVLSNIINDFPELSPLLGKQKGEVTKGVIPDQNADLIGKKVNGTDAMTGTKGGSGNGSGINIAEGDKPGDRIDKNGNKEERGQEHEGRRVRPGLMLGFEDNANRDELGWLVGNTIWINEGHPAYKKAKNAKADNYHIALSVAWVLSGYLESEKKPQMFINRFLSSWGNVI